MAFSTRIEVRGYELDALGHVNHAVYHLYAEVARTKAFVAAGCDLDLLTQRRTAPVLLTTTVNFRRELRAGDEVDVSCAAKFGDGKTFTLEQMLTKMDGTLSAEVYCVLGMMDLEARRLHADPRAVLESGGFDLAKMNG
ncbi:acyl-CoA thioesterase [Actinophytocola oryzae]|uniref:Acyl-CoA thioester hydrolase n=1 Tax=Actinophytocola oryzae TaxID=502181 RepID=A0A4R7UPD4_9PSEU|nr:acyl-CoA thioesterase [Actinophytocola oryzae]TDV35412.1 acyl-CoA thioester hydrolase [Actinophytocola oryzae]